MNVAKIFSKLIFFLRLFIEMIYLNNGRKRETETFLLDMIGVEFRPNLKKKKKRKLMSPAQNRELDFCKRKKRKEKEKHITFTWSTLTNNWPLALATRLYTSFR